LQPRWASDNDTGTCKLFDVFSSTQKSHKWEALLEMTSSMCERYIKARAKRSRHAPGVKLIDKLTPTEALEKAKHYLGPGWFNFTSCTGSSLFP